MTTAIRIPPRPRPDNSTAFGSSYRVTVQWMTLRKPFTLMQEDTRVPFSILLGTGPRQPAKMVIQSPKRFKSDASFQADSGERSDDVETSTRATGFRYPGIVAG